jgi:hypothetical protein
LTDDLPEARRPRLTPANEERLAPVDARSRESYEIAEAAMATKVEKGERLDELLALIAVAEDSGAVPQAVLEMGESSVHRVEVALRPPAKKPGG